MKFKDYYKALVIFHIFIGLVLFFIPVSAKIFFYLVVGYFIFRIIIAPSSKKTFEVLLACAYVVGAEVLFRMTGGGLFYESSKYFVILFILMGTFFKGISGNGYPYFIYLIALVPSVLVASMNLDLDLNFRKSVAFVLSGPVCLGVSAVFCFNKRVSKSEILDIIMFMSLPVIAMTTYLFFFNPSIKEVLNGTQSNFAASGGFGPNQVSTLLGLGMFALTVRLFLKSNSLPLKIINSILLGAIAYRAIITFSRGGVLAAIIVVSTFLVILYKESPKRSKNQILASFLTLIIAISVTWVISSNQTEGLIDKRYSNQDARGVEKGDVSTGRVDLFVNELEGFLLNPFFGVGASGMKNIRYQSEGIEIASHNELSRLLSEHGLLGVIIFTILLLKPLSFRTSNKNNIFFFAFLAFWFATINHSAMRIAAPAFIYALSLLNIKNEKRPIYRKLPSK